MKRVTGEASDIARAALGASLGFSKYYVRPELSARRAWMVLGVGVLAYEWACPPGQTLSEGCDKALERHPLLTTLAIGTVALHLANRLPLAIDPLHNGLNIIKKL